MEGYKDEARCVLEREKGNRRTVLLESGPQQLFILCSSNSWKLIAAAAQTATELKIEE